MLEINERARSRCYYKINLKKTHVHQSNCQILLCICDYYIIRSCCMIKPTKWPVRPATTQISLGIRPVWSESSLSTWRNIGPLTTYWADSEDWSDWADVQADLRLRWVHIILLSSLKLNVWMKRKELEYFWSQNTWKSEWNLEKKSFSELGIILHR